MTTIPLCSCRRHRSIPRFDVKYCNNPSASVAQHNVGSACVKSVTHNFPEAIKALLHPIASDAGKILRPHRIRKISVDKNAIQSSTNWVRLGLRCDTPIHSQQNIGKYIFRSFNSRILRVLSNSGLSILGPNPHRIGVCITHHLTRKGDWLGSIPSQIFRTRTSFARAGPLPAIRMSGRHTRLVRVEMRMR